MKAQKSIDFEITLNDLYPNRAEPKVERVSVALVGATASNATINCLLEHLGESSALRRDGTVVTFGYPPLSLPVGAAMVDLGPDKLPAGESEAFWGRSPASKWRLMIEPKVIEDSKVDLSGLTQIVLNVSYKAFLMI